MEAIKIVGKILAGVFALSCGITVASALISLHVFSGGMTTMIFTAIFFVGTTAANYKMCKETVPEILIDIFGKERIFQGLIENEKGERLSNIKIFFLIIGFILALSVGITFGTLTYYGFFTVVNTLSFFTILSAGFPPIAVFFALSVFICLSALMLKSISKILKLENPYQTCIDILFDLIDTNPELPRNKGKSTAQIVIERAITILVTLVVLPLSIVGLVMTMNACTPGITNIVLQTPWITPAVADIVSKIITFGLALLGQLPFAIRTAIITASSIFEKYTWQESASKAADENNTIVNYLVDIGFLVLRVINAVGNGLVAMMGAKGPVALPLAGLGGTINSFASTADDPSSPQPQTPLLVASSQHNDSIRAFLNGHQNTLLGVHSDRNNLSTVNDTRESYALLYTF